LTLLSVLAAPIGRCLERTEQAIGATSGGILIFGTDQAGARSVLRFMTPPLDLPPPRTPYLTIVACHDRGRVVWVAEGRTKAALASFFDALGPERRDQIAAVSDRR
jgi:hypothetical protein